MPAYDIFILWNWPKTSSFWLPYQCHSSSADCARELFKPSKHSPSLLVCNAKNIFSFGFQFFCEWRHKQGRFLAILAHVTWPRAKPLDQSILLKFSLETWLESESFEPLINFLAFLVQMLRSEINKITDDLINSLASGCFRGFSGKKCLNACGFAREYLCSCSGYRPGLSVKRHGKSSSLHSKKSFCLGGVVFLWVMS